MVKDGWQICVADLTERRGGSKLSDLTVLSQALGSPCKRWWAARCYRPQQPVTAQQSVSCNEVMEATEEDQRTLRATWQHKNQARRVVSGARAFAGAWETLRQRAREHRRESAQNKHGVSPARSSGKVEHLGGGGFCFCVFAFCLWMDHFLASRFLACCCNAKHTSHPGAHIRCWGCCCRGHMEERQEHREQGHHSAFGEGCRFPDGQNVASSKSRIQQ